MPTITSILSDFRKLDKKEQAEFKHILMSSSVAGMTKDKFVSKNRFADGRVCPHCGKSHIRRYGFTANGTQRYLCCECGKTFKATTNTVLSGSTKDLATWEKYIDCMMNGFSIRKSAGICGIHRNTAFLWRHKILDTLQAMIDEVELNGIVEADETFFRYRTREITREVKPSRCQEHRITEASRPRFVEYRTRRSVSLVRSIGKASPLQESQTPAESPRRISIKCSMIRYPKTQSS